MRATLLLLHGLLATALFAQDPVLEGTPMTHDLADRSLPETEASGTDRTLILFPNPTRGAVRVSRGQGALMGNWSLVDGAGQEVLVGRFRGFGDEWLDLDPLPPGRYWLRPELGADWVPAAITVTD